MGVCAVPERAVRFDRSPIENGVVAVEEGAAVLGGKKSAEVREVEQ